MRKTDVVFWQLKRHRGQATLPQLLHNLWERGLPAMRVDRLDSVPALYVRLIFQRQTVEITLKIGQETVSNLMPTVGGNRRGMG